MIDRSQAVAVGNFIFFLGKYHGIIHELAFASLAGFMMRRRENLEARSQFFLVLFFFRTKYDDILRYRRTNVVQPTRRPRSNPAVKVARG